MSIGLYSNGIIEEFKPKSFVFTDDEILNIFNDFNRIRTKRLLEIPNVWCIWGENFEHDQTSYSLIGSNVIEEHIFSLIIFVHDSELDPSWMLTDNVIYNSYEQFNMELLEFIDIIAKETIKDNENRRKIEGNENLIMLDTIGSTEDKKVLFELDLRKQNKGFYKDENFIHFATKVRNYLKENYIVKGTMFYVYEDNKMIMYIKNKYIEELLGKIISLYERREEYEKCKEIQTVIEKWKNSNLKQRRKGENNKK